MLKPNDSIEITFDPGFVEGERPIAITPNPGDVFLSPAGINTVRVTNATNRTIGFVVAVVPDKYVHLGMIPWAQVLMQLKRIGRNDIMNIVGYMVTRMASR